MQWHFSRAGQVWGPYPWEALASMAAAGQLLPDDLICTDGQSWHPVTQFVALPTPTAFEYPAPHDAAIPFPAPTSTASPHAPTRPRTSKWSGYACLAGAAIILVGAGVRLAMQVDSASAGAADSVAKIEARMLQDGAPSDLAASAAAGKPLDARDRARLSTRAQLTAAFIPTRLRHIAAHKQLPLTIVSAVLSLCAAAILTLTGASRIRRAKTKKKEAKSATPRGQVEP